MRAKAQLVWAVISATTSRASARTLIPSGVTAEASTHTLIPSGVTAEASTRTFIPSGVRAEALNSKDFWDWVQGSVSVFF